jgi:Asp-tRNA(Asn)/Glu-tRNA(Gln) amidotransferase A subunit family amidase
MVPFCTASDGGGSIRTPAAFTGLVGLKPCYGRIPTLGVTWLAQNAVVGALTTTATDAALLLDVMAGPDPRDRTCLPPPGRSYLDTLDALPLDGLRVAFSVDLGFAVVEPEVAVLVERAARVLVAACGATLVDRRVVLEDYIRTYAHVEGVDQFVGIPEDLWRHHLDRLDPRVAPGWASATRATLPKLAAVEEERRRLVAEMAEVFADVDLLVTPMTCRTAFAAEGPMPTEVAGHPGHGGMAVIHGMLANLTNLPAVSLPAGLAGDGLPVGMQVIGPRHREDLLLAVAHCYEQAHPWPRHAPRPAA